MVQSSETVNTEGAFFSTFLLRIGYFYKTETIFITFQLFRKTLSYFFYKIDFPEC